MELLIVLAGQQNHDDYTRHSKSDLKCKFMMKALGREILSTFYSIFSAFHPQ